MKLLRRTWLDETKSAATHLLLSFCRPRKSRVTRFLTAIHAQKHRAAPDDFHGPAVRGQRDLTDRSVTFGTDDLHVTKSVCPAGIRGEKPECLRSVVGFASASTFRAQFGTYADLVTTDFDQAPTSFGNPIPSGCRDLSRLYFRKRRQGSDVRGDGNCAILESDPI